jgi:nitric oxide reductase activation protein
MVRVLRSKVDGTTPDRRHNMELLKGGLDLVQNYDGFMVERATEHFTKKEGRKILLVLSDGEPYAPAYNGSAADAHTKQKIAEARKKGFVVISISLVSGVVEANNRIYGSEWNIDASTNLVGQLQKIIAKVSQK